MSIKLIIALDFDSIAPALALVDQLDPTNCALKIGLQMHTLFGANFVKQLIARGFKIFLDLKFHDIPTTVTRACQASAELGVWMINVHASGGLNMMRAATQGLLQYGDNRPLLIAVTVLTSLSDAELASIGIAKSLNAQVCALAQLAQLGGLDGVVSSAVEVPLIKAACGKEFLVITPGIRMPGNDSNDQTRIVTPESAIKAGADYLVVGRSITHAINPLKVIQELLRYVG